MPVLFHPANAELLIAVSRLSLQAIDRMVGAMPPDDPLPAGELSALMRLLSGALNLGIDARDVSNEGPAANDG